MSTIEILNTSVRLFIALDTILIPFGIIAGIVFLIVAAYEKDAAKKKLMKKIGIWGLVLPILLMLVVLSLWGLVSIGSNTLK
jgi:hypothetical protein